MTAQAPAAPGRANRLRRMAVMLALPVVLLAGGAGWWLTTGDSVSTDNAYLHQARLPMASDLAGRIVQVAIAENQPVKKGDLLFQVDPEPYRLALAQADVGLDSARLTVERLKADLAEAEAQAKMAQDTATYQQAQLQRQEALAKRGVATDSALDDARHAARAASEQATVAGTAVVVARAALGDPAAPTDDHPTVRAAMVACENAAYNLHRTEVRAPADGIVYQAGSFRAGQMVSAGQTLFTLVETGEVWVEANFKETQLADIRVGQPVEVTFDLDRRHPLSGRVEAIGAGTGAEFSLLPAQNATGNWVKVEQRVPVRLRLDDTAAAAGLASGLSADVVVDTSSVVAP